MLHRGMGDSSTRTHTLPTVMSLHTTVQTKKRVLLKFDESDFIAEEQLTFTSELQRCNSFDESNNLQVTCNLEIR